MTEPALVLAAGEASRFGRPKQLARVRGETLVERATRTARDAGLEPLVVLGAHRSEVEGVLDDECRRTYAADWAEGMGASLVQGVRALGEAAAERFFVLTCDQVLVTAADLRELGAACDGVDAAAGLYDGVVGVPACFRSRCRHRLLDVVGDRGARALLRGDDLSVRRVPMPRAAVDVDTPADLDALRALSDQTVQT